MNKVEPRRHPLLLIALPVLLVFSIWLLRRGVGWVIDKTHSAPSVRVLGTRSTLYLIGYASKVEMMKSGRWPTSLDDLAKQSNCDPKTLVDAWNLPLFYQPYDPAKGYGIVISYGQDGKPGGNGPDADLEFRFHERTSDADRPRSE